MKKMLLVMLLLAPVFGWAQQSPVQAIFDKYSGREGYTSVSINKDMFNLFSSMADNDDKDMKDIVSQLNSIRILTADAAPNGSVKAGNDFYKEVAAVLTRPAYEDLMTVNDGGQPVKFVVKKKGDMITELVMVVGGDDACLIDLDGNIDLKQISKLSKAMNLKGLDKLNGIKG